MKTLLSFIFLFSCSTVLAENSLPQLELGAALFALQAPDYRGSRSDSSYLVPVPYIKYRGEKLRVDEGAQGVFLESENLLFSISANLNLPVDDDIPEREGMDELEAILEIGPSLNYRFYRLDNSAWWIDLPLRFAFTLDDQFEDIGQIFQPRLSWRKPATRLGEWKLRINLGPLYASNLYHEYFYSVGAEDATAERAEFDADGGFSGYRAEFTYSKRFGKLWLGGFLRYDSLDDSKIEDSPLVQDESAWISGIALGWVFHQK